MASIQTSVRQYVINKINNETCTKITPIKWLHIINGLFWPKNLSKLLQKGMYVPNFKKIGQPLIAPTIQLQTNNILILFNEIRWQPSITLPCPSTLRLFINKV